MSKYESRKSLAEKIYWVGGIDEFLLSYGFFPDEFPDEALEIVAQDLAKAVSDYIYYRDEFMELLPEVEDFNG